MAPLVSLEELTRRIEGGIGQDDADRALALLDDASALIRAEGVSTWEAETAPAVAISIALACAKRAFVKPEGISSEVTVNFSGSFSPSPSALYLTANERKLIKRAAGNQLWTVSTTRSGPEVADVNEVVPRNTPVSDLFNTWE